MAGLLLASACSDTSVLGDIDGGQVQRAPEPYDECGNGMDDDGDGLIDEDCFCGPGETQSCFSGLYPNRAIGICGDGVQSCQIEGSIEFGRWGACEDDALPTGEICGDGLDNDCDAAVDEGCECTEGDTWACGEDFGSAPCQSGTQVCLPDGSRSECRGAVGPSAEVCEDGIDNDCDGTADEGCDCVPLPEVCDDGIDNDCDGEADEAACAMGSPLDVVEMTAGRYHTCAGVTPGEVLCWGRNDRGALGDGTTTDRLTPVAVTGLVDALEVSASDFSTCARRLTGDVSCWGPGSAGLLGDGTMTDSAVPRPVPTLSGVLGLSSGTTHVCALRSGGDTLCWGENFFGELGEDPAVSYRFVPTLVSGVAAGVQVSAGDFYSCTRHATGEVTCWGDNRHRQLGSGSTDDISLPMSVAGLTDAVEMSASREYGCARRSTGEVACWGYNGHGQLGDGTTTNRPMQVMVSGLTDAVELDVGVDHACARRSTGQVVCWGRNHVGQLGDGTTTNRHTPIPVPGLTDVTELTSGPLHSCARRSTGQIVCWGFNAHGQLGDGTTTDRTTPTPVVGL